MMMKKATRWSKTPQMPTRGGSIATNIVDDGWGCGFLRVATKAISNGKGNADDNLQDNAATTSFPTASELMDTKVDPRGGHLTLYSQPDLHCPGPVKKGRNKI
jgi:hypothetical protein